MGSFQSVHSNAVEKNRILSTLLLHGVETTVDRFADFTQNIFETTVPDVTEQSVALLQMNKC